jgi:predicted anti-sigma-YlaC factor YlaD
MFCDEALDAVEPIAAGDLTPDGRIAEHLASCPNCAAALVTARQLERVLRRRGVPEPPPQFTARTLTRVRRARWRSDQFLDVGFNVAIIMVVVAVFGGVWMLLNRTGLAVVSTDAVDLFGSALVTMVRRVAPSLPLYAGAAALLASALGIWWWAERDASLRDG